MIFLQTTRTRRLAVGGERSEKRWHQLPCQRLINSEVLSGVNVDARALFHGLSCGNLRLLRHRQRNKADAPPPSAAHRGFIIMKYKTLDWATYDLADCFQVNIERIYDQARSII